MKCVNKELLKKAAPIEIIRALHTMIMQHQAYPTPYEYRTAYRRLVEKHPALKDETASGYVSLLYKYLYLNFS